MKFHLGTHMPGWLTSAPSDVPLFISHRQQAACGQAPMVRSRGGEE